MGFGLIFTGYLSVFCFRMIPAELIGFLLILQGLKKLLPYSGYVKKARTMAFFCFAYSAVFSVVWVLNVLKIVPVSSIPQIVTIADTMLYLSLLYFFSVFLYFALSEIAKDTGYEKGVKLAKGCLSIASVYYVVSILYDIFRTVLEFHPLASKNIVIGINAFLIAQTLFGLIWYIVTAVLLYSCYARIVTQDILDKEQNEMLNFDAKFARKRKK